MGRVLTPYRAGVTTDGLKHNKYRSRCFGRGACSRRAGGCDIHAAFDSPTGLDLSGDGHRATSRCAPTPPRTRSWSIRTTGKARGVAFIDTETRTVATRRRAKVVVVAASTLESARLLLLSKSTAHPERHRQLERPRRPQLLRARDGAGRHRPGEGSRSASRARWTTGGRAASTCRASATSSDKQPDFIRGYGFEGSGGSTMFPEQRVDTPGFGAAYKKTRARLRRRVHQHGRLRRSARRATRTTSTSIPSVKDKWGIPVLRFHYQVRRQRKEDVRGHGRRRAGDVRGGRLRDRQRDREHADRGLVDPRARHGAHGQRIRRRRC